MKSVLMSIQPKWCELIVSGKKTVEVRKTKPKLDVPFKVYIYMTKGETVYHPRDVFGNTALNGKVIGEFVCDKVDRMAHCGSCNSDIRLSLVDEKLYIKPLDYEYLNKCKLSYFEIDEYSNGCDVYGWHISNLVIYDKPKELGEFYQKCKSYDKDDWENDDCLECENPCGNGGKLYLKRPPQSWCYVEGGVGE